MTPEQTYQSVHDRWTAFSKGDFSTSPGDPCDFCHFALPIARALHAPSKCDYCPAFHALGMVCYDHPVVEKFNDTDTNEEAAKAAKDVLKLLESNKDKVIQYMEGK